MYAAIFEKRQTDQRRLKTKAQELENKSINDPHRLADPIVLLRIPIV
jgi:hypothetical protein